MKTKKNKKDKKLKKNIKQAVAILYPDKHYSKKNRVKGRVHFTQMGNRLTIKYKIQHLPKGYHGFHIHQFGDLTKGCKTAGPHFNTYKKNIHGGPKSKIKHNGDLGNIFNIKPTTSGTKIVSSKILNLVLLMVNLSTPVLTVIKSALVSCAKLFPEALPAPSTKLYVTLPLAGTLAWKSHNNHLTLPSGQYPNALNWPAVLSISTS